MWPHNTGIESSIHLSIYIMEIFKYIYIWTFTVDIHLLVCFSLLFGLFMNFDGSNGNQSLALVKKKTYFFFQNFLLLKNRENCLCLSPAEIGRKNETAADFLEHFVNTAVDKLGAAEICSADDLCQPPPHLENTFWYEMCIFYRAFQIWFVKKHLWNMSFEFWYPSWLTLGFYGAQRESLDTQQLLLEMPARWHLPKCQPRNCHIAPDWFPWLPSMHVAGNVNFLVNNPRDKVKCPSFKRDEH